MHVGIATPEADGVGVIDPLFGTKGRSADPIVSAVGITDATLRAARRAGLRVIYRHKQGYIHGRDWIDYILNSPARQELAPASSDLT